MVADEGDDRVQQGGDVQDFLSRQERGMRADASHEGKDCRSTSDGSDGAENVARVSGRGTRTCTRWRWRWTWIWIWSCSRGVSNAEANRGAAAAIDDDAKESKKEKRKKKRREKKRKKEKKKQAKRIAKNSVQSETGKTTIGMPSHLFGARQGPQARGI